MNRQEQTNIINDLAAFVKNHREDQFGEHESLYYEILKQWVRLDRFDAAAATPESQALYDRYWTAMGQWHQDFVAARDRLADPTPISSLDLQEHYENLIADLADETIANLPLAAARGVARDKNFARLLNLQLEKMEDLYTDVMLPIDFLLLVEYWKLINQVVQGREVEE